MGIVFVAAQVALGLFVWKYRETPDFSTGGRIRTATPQLEIVWTVLTADSVRRTEPDGQQRMGEPSASTPAEAGAVQVEVTGMQFAWYFRYPGARRQIRRYQPEVDGSFGRQRSRGGPGHRDAAAKDDVVTGTMFLPVDRAGRSEPARRGRDPQFLCSRTCASSRMRCPASNIHMHFKPTADWRI